MKKTKLFTLALVLGLFSTGYAQEKESELIKFIQNVNFKDDGSVDIENTKFDIAKTQKRGYCPDGETLEPGWDGGYDANGKEEGVWTEYVGSCEKKDANKIGSIETYKNGVLLNAISYYYPKSQTEPLIAPTKYFYYGTIEGYEHLGKVPYFKNIIYGYNGLGIYGYFLLPNSAEHKESYKKETITIVLNSKAIGLDSLYIESYPVDSKCYYIDDKMYKHASRKVGPYSSYAALLKQADERGKDSIFESSKTQEWHLKSGNLVVDSDIFDDKCNTDFFYNAVERLNN